MFSVYYLFATRIYVIIPNNEHTPNGAILMGKDMSWEDAKWFVDNTELSTMVKE